MMAAVDVQYEDSRGHAAALVFADPADSEPVEEICRWFEDLEDYVPGQFYRRELPCVFPLLREFLASYDLTTVIVDGYVDLGPEGRPGLGRHLFKALGKKIEVVGVAKSLFKDTPAREVLRGRRSRRPLWVTSTGDLDVAAEMVESMDGEHRMPTLLKRVDQLARGIREPADA